MISPLCISRGFWYWLRGLNVSGHIGQEQPPGPGQPKCVTILKCMACGKIQVCWEECARCSVSAGEKHSAG